MVGSYADDDDTDCQVRIRLVTRHLIQHGAARHVDRVERLREARRGHPRILLLPETGAITCCPMWRLRKSEGAQHDQHAPESSRHYLMQLRIPRQSCRCRYRTKPRRQHSKQQLSARPHTQATSSTPGRERGATTADGRRPRLGWEATDRWGRACGIKAYSCLRMTCVVQNITKLSAARPTGIGARVSRQGHVTD